MASGLLKDYIGRGLASARPTTPAPGTGVGVFYYATDTSTLSVWDGAAWDTVGGGGGGSGGPITIGSHVYWRVRGGGKVTNTTYSAWSGLDFRSTPGGSNIATGGTATTWPVQASSGPTGAIGGNGGSDFIQVNDDYAMCIFVAYQFPSAVSIREISIYPMSFGVTRTPNVFIIDYSDDGINWNHATTVSVGHGSMTVGTRVLLPVPAQIYIP